MHRNRILLAVAVITGLVAPVGALAFSGGPAMAAPSSPAPMAYTCTGGDFASGNLTSIPSGIYASITVTGVCALAPRCRDHRDRQRECRLRVPCSTRKARRRRSPSDTTSPRLRARSSAWAACLIQRDTRRDIRAPVELTPTLDPTTALPTSPSTGTSSPLDANTVLLNGITVKGNVALIGGGEQAGNPWPIKTNTIGGNLVVFGATPEWLGVVVNKIGGNVILGNITVAPGETIDVANNTIGWNLVCWNLAPAVSGGFPGEVNVVGGKAIGQCPLAGS